MSVLTRGGIAMNLESSPYKAIVKYEFGEVSFMFSSNLYKEKFLNKINENRTAINESLSKRFNVTVDFDLLCDVKLYSTIEKRGFLVVCEGEKLCQRNIILSGVTVTSKN